MFRTLREEQEQRRRCWDSNGSINCNSIEAIIGSILAMAVAPFTISVFLDLYEMMENIYYNENRFTNVLALVATASVVAAAIYFLAPIVLPILAAASTAVIVGAVAGALIALAATVKLCRWLFTELGNVLNSCMGSTNNNAQNNSEEGFTGYNRL